MKRRGLTLIELITVISIIAILTGILLPALHGARERARSLLCRTHLKELNLSMALYTQDNNSFPFGHMFTTQTIPFGCYVGDANLDPLGWFWFNFIGDYYSHVYLDKRNSLLRCPSRIVTQGRTIGNVLACNYGVNQSICKSDHGYFITKRPEFFGPRPLKPDEVRHPSRTLLLMDSGYSLICWSHATTTPLYEPNPAFPPDNAYIPGLSINQTRSNIYEGQEYDAIHGRHANQRINVNFADGHIENRKAEDLLVERVDQGEISYDHNRYPLWDPF